MWSDRNHYTNLVQFREKRVIVVRTSLGARVRMFCSGKKWTGVPHVRHSRCLASTAKVWADTNNFMGFNWHFDVKLAIRRQIGDSTSNCDLTSNVAIKRPCSWVEVRSRCEVSTAADMGTPVHFFPEQNSLILCASRTSVGRSCKNEVWQAADSHINLFVKKNQWIKRMHTLKIALAHSYLCETCDKKEVICHRVTNQSDLKKAMVKRQWCEATICSITTERL